MREYFDKAVDAVKEGIEQTTAMVSKPLEVVTSSIGKIPYFGALLTAGEGEEQQFDEKHYFVIPFRQSEIGYSLHSIRCLPKDVPPINDLPKKRIFHVPNEETDELVKTLLLETAAIAPPEKEEGDRLGDPLMNLADQIDQVDGKVTNGILLIGGLVAFLNPLVGAGIAAKALIPGLAGAVSKFGLRSVGKVANDMQLNSDIRQAENEVLMEFKGSETVKLLNPVIRELEMSLNTSESEHDPLLSFDFETVTFDGAPDRRLLRLTCQAITNQYEPALASERAAKQAGLRGKEYRWLDLVREVAKH